MGAYWSTPEGSTLKLKGGGEEKEEEEGQSEEEEKKEHEVGGGRPSKVGQEGDEEEGEDETWRRSREEEMTRFREELARKRRARQEAMAGISSRLRKDREAAREAGLRAKLAQEELNILRQTVGLANSEKTIVSECKESEINSERVVREAEDELERIGEAARLEAGEETQRRLEAAEEELVDLRGRLEKMGEMEKQVVALKDVSRIGKQLLMLRERQVEELTKKLKVIEATGTEYEKEFEKIKELRSLYEERAVAAEREHRVTLERETARLAVAEAKLESSEEKARLLEERSEEAEGKVAALDKTVQELRQELSDLRLEMASKSEQLYHSEGQMSVVNNLLAQVLLGPELDFSKLVRVLEDNHDLINDLTSQGEMDRLAAVLMEIAGKADGLDEQVRPEPGEKLTREEIASNMHQVWRVLVELLSHHGKKECQDVVPESCYKSVETPFGTKEVISPSRTYIKLKDLILEKNCLVKEVGRLKTLNTHLETRLDKQEKRLSLVTSELHKTWAVVNTLRAQHQQLHNHEKILRYELKHKRMMLEELKKELEICREQWEEARQKNSQTEEDWKVLRSEFASRKRKQCNSTESGYEDEEASESPVELPTSPLPESRTSPVPKEDLVSEWPKEESEPVPQTGESVDEPVLGWEPHKQSETTQNLENVDEIKESPLATDEVSEEPRQEPIPGSSHLEQQDSEIPETTSRSKSTDRVMGLPDDLGMEIRVPVLGWETDHTLDTTQDVQERMSEPSVTVSEPPPSSFHSLALQMETRVPGLESTQNTTSSENDQTRIPDPSTKDKEEDRTSTTTVGDSRIPNLEATMGLPDDLQMEIRVPVLAWETEGAQSSTQQEPTEVPPVPPTPPTPPPLPADPVPPRRRTAEEVLAGREARLKRLEEQCQSLFTKMSSTSQRSDLISNRLEQLHEQYGDQPQPSTSRQPE